MKTPRRVRIAALASILTALWLQSIGYGQCECLTTEDELVAPMALTTADQFGSAVSIDGAMLIGGAPGVTVNSESSGAAWIFRSDGYDWLEEAQIVPDNPADGDRFGDAVSIHGDVALVGAPRKTIGGFLSAGAAYVFRFNGTEWQPEQNLTPEEPGTGTQFGYSVAVQGDLAVIGAPFEGSNAGAVFVYHKSGSSWGLLQELIPEAGGTGDFFGISVAIDGDVIVVGGSNLGVTYTGSTWVFRHDGTSWEYETQLVPPSLAAGDSFGYSVDVDGDVIVSGAPLDDTPLGGNAAGSVHVFRYDGSSWDHEDTLYSCDNATGAAVGWSVSIGDPYIIAGAPSDDFGLGGNQGSAHVYKITPTGWVHQAMLTGAGAQNQDEFGHSVSIGRGLAAVGVWKDDDGPNDDAGTVRAYHGLGECDCCYADVTDDGTVGPADLAEVLANWGSCEGCPADINDDGVVGPADLAAVLAAWNCTCQSGASGFAGGESGESSTGLDSASFDVIVLLLGWPDVPSFMTWLSSASDSEVQALGEQLQALLGG